MTDAHFEQSQHAKNKTDFSSHELTAMAG